MIEPVTHRVLIKPDRLEDVDPNLKRARAMGIEIPELESRKREQASVDTGTVVAYGPTVFQDFNTDNPLVPGMHVAYARHAGKLVTDPESKIEYVLLNDEDIVCIFHKE